MYYYIVDPQKISQKEFERVQNHLYSSLSEFRISGEVVRVTGLRTIQQLVENAFIHEAKTIVAVGDDQTLHQVINAIGKREIVVGYIPLIKTELGNIFGIKDIIQAAKTIASRRIEAVDLGVVNNNYFLSKLSFGTTPAGWRSINDNSFEFSFTVDDQYKASKKIIGGLIVNSRNSYADDKMSYPADGILDILLLPQISRWESFKYRAQIKDGTYDEIPKTSIVHAKKIEIHSTGLTLKVGDWVLAKTPAVIEVVPRSLKIIVGRERKF